MVQLARHYGTGPASLAGIAAEEDLPRAYLEQLVVSLREAGLVVSTRGAHGGYELARAPELIPMSVVLRALEGPIAPMMCASDDPEHATTCDRSSRCTVNLLWVRVRDAITGALDSMTLADLVPERRDIPSHRPRSHHQGAVTALVTDQPTTDQHLVIRGLRVAPVASPDHEILQGIDLDVGKGEVHAIMGPNGSGKTTLAYALMGHPRLRDQGRHGHLEGPRHPRAVGGQAGPARALPRLPVPHRDPRSERRELHPLARSTPSSRASTRTPTSTRPTRSRAASRCATSATPCARRWRC